MERDLGGRERLLMEVFPRLFRVALNREESISDEYREVNDVPQWSMMSHSAPSLSEGHYMILKRIPTKP